MFIIKFSKKQLEKLADQIRLLSWAQGAIFTSSSGLHFSVTYATLGMIVGLWLSCQGIALELDKRSEKL